MKGMWIAVAAGLALGCTAADGVTVADKGEESPLPGKDDSLRKPTEHGDLTFGVEARTALTAEEGYHAWTFTLTGEAAVSFEVAPYADNLDTVMYLHGRKADDELWGNYLKRNDDHDEHLWSRIEAKLDAGQYRVLVKGYKDAVHGAFGLSTACEGEGCPVAASDAPASLPAETVFTAGCTARLMDVLSAPVESTRSAQVAYRTDRPALVGVERLAVDYYRSYWVDEIGWGWEEHADEDDKSGPLLDLFTVDMGTGGAVVTVAFAYGDEVTVSFVFDGEGRLVTLFHSEQSPRVAWFCAAEGEDVAVYPGEFCVGALIDYAPHKADDVTKGNFKVTAGATAGLAPILSMAVEAYVAARGLQDGDEITGDLVEWESAIGGRGARVTLQAAGAEAVTYEMADPGHGSTWLLLGSDAQQTSFICDERYP